MTTPLLIPCPTCNGLNRIPAERLADHPKCGRCKSAVLLSKPFELTQGDYASQIKGDLPLLVDVGGLVRAVQVVCAGVRTGGGAVGGQVSAGQTGQRGESPVIGAVGDSLDPEPDSV